MTHIGELDEWITIERLVRGADDGQGGYLSSTWEKLCECWAKVETGSGREIIFADQTSHRVGYVITIRRDSEVTAAMRVIWQERTLAIIGVPPTKRKQFWTVLQCEEQLAS